MHSEITFRLHSCNFFLCGFMNVSFSNPEYLEAHHMEPQDSVSCLFIRNCDDDPGFTSATFSNFV